VDQFAARPEARGPGHKRQPEGAAEGIKDKRQAANRHCNGNHPNSPAGILGEHRVGQREPREKRRENEGPQDQGRRYAVHRERRRVALRVSQAQELRREETCDGADGNGQPAGKDGYGT
jgi:hypothetical protein